VYGDPAILLPRFIRPPGEVHRGAIGIVPHYVDYEEALGRWGVFEGVRVVDVRGPFREVVVEIASCEAVLSSSLHGLIIPHAYGVPAAWIQLSGRLFGDNVKFQDYFASLGLERSPQPAQVPEGMDREGMMELASAAPFPEPEVLAEDLYSACPFR
jgi:hypothetical protein